MIDPAAYGLSVAASGAVNKTALQDAIDAAAIAGDGVQIGPGDFTVDPGLRIRTADMRVLGAGRGTKLRRSAAKYGQAFFVGPTPAALPTAAALATGAGPSLHFDGTDKHWLNLSTDAENRTTLQGQTAFTDEWFYKPSALDSMRVLFSAAHKLTSVATATEAYVVKVWPDGHVDVSVRIGGQARVITTAAGVVSVGVAQHWELSYDGAMLRLFVAGQLVGSVAATGAVEQDPMEWWCCGPYSQWYLDNSAALGGPNGDIDGIRRSVTIARHTENFAAPTAKPAWDGYTVALVNFDTIDGPFVVGHSGLLQAPTWFVWGSRHDSLTFGSGAGGGAEIGQLQLIGAGIHARASTHLWLHDLLVTEAWSPIILQDNCFLSDIERVKVVGGNVPMVITGASGVTRLVSVTLNLGLYCLLVRNAGIEADRLFAFDASRAPLALLGSGSAMTATLQFSHFTDEASVSLAADAIVDECPTVAVGCTFERISSVGPNIQLIGNEPLTLVGGSMHALTGTSARVQALNRTWPIDARGVAARLGNAVPITGPDLLSGNLSRTNL